MTAAKNGVYSWAKKALPSCKRRAEVLSSCDDIKIMWRSTGAYRVRYAPYVGRKVYSTEHGRNIFHFNFRRLELNGLFGIHIPISSIIANRITINVLCQLCETVFLLSTSRIIHSLEHKSCIN